MYMTSIFLTWIKQDYVEAAEDFWQQQRPPTVEEVNSISERPHPYVRNFKKLSVTQSHTGLDHPDVMYYLYILGRDANVGDRVPIIVAGGIGFNAKRLMENWGVDGTNEARAGAVAGFRSQRRGG